MLLKLVVRLSALSLGLSYVTCTTPQQQAQLATLHERMNQMISSLYSSPLLSKTATSSSEEFPSTPSSQESTYSYPVAPAPQIVYVSPSPSYFEAGHQPTDYGYPTTASPVPRLAWPYPYDYSSYQTQFASPSYPPSYSRTPYPDYSRPVYPQIAASPTQPPLSQYPLPMPYPLPYPSSVPFPAPTYSPFPVAPPLPSLPYPPPQVPCPPPVYPQGPYPSPVAYPPAIPYPPSLPIPYPSPMPQPYAPPLPMPYPPSISIPYPPSIPVPYSPTISYPQPTYPPPPAYPKPVDMLPQPQYDYST